MCSAEPAGMADEVTTEINLGAVDTLVKRLEISVVKKSTGSQTIQIYVIPKTGNRSGEVMTLDRAAFAKLKALISRVNEEVTKDAEICRGCKTPIRDDGAFAEKRAPCPFCGRVKMP